MRALLRPLRNPHRAYPSIIVAGTNGKGSTCAALTSILGEAGYRTGLYTSPHLVDIRERWTIGGQAIDPNLLDECIDILHAAAKRVDIAPTYFEALTLIAFIAFERAKCDVVVLEVGMGGRLDATNVVRPIAALITPIGLDHTEYLGNTIRKISAEKAGIIHRGAIALTSNSDPDVVDVLRRRAAKFGKRLHVVRTEHSSPLAGDFQRMNAALAAEAAVALKKRLPKITDDAIERGIARTRWRGRLERMTVRGREVWIDGCHNAHAARVIAPFIERSIAKPRTLVFGIMSDKNFREVAAILFPLFERIITTEPYPPRSEPAESLAGIAAEMGISAESVAHPPAAIERALASGRGPVVIAGSLYLAGAAVEFLDHLRAGDQ